MLNNPKANRTMNKKIFSYMTVAAIMGGMSSCSMEHPFTVGEGTMFISTRINSDVKVETRSEEDELAASTKVWIYSDEGVVRKYDAMSEIPTNGIKLISGEYTVKAWAGKLSYASFEDRWFEGEKMVTIESDKSQSVEVECKIANVVASVSYPDNIDEYISDYSMTIFHKGGSLTFDGKDDRKGYFIMPDDVEDLNYSITFKTEGQEKIVTGVIEDVLPAHHYILNVNAKKELGAMDGAAYIEITIDDSMTEVNDEIIISTPPAITGYGFELATPVAGESGTIGRKSVYVAATSAITNLQLTGLPNIEGLDAIDFMHADQSYIDRLKDEGIYYEIDPKAEAPSQLIKLVFDDKYLNDLPNSEEPYVITIAATDSKKKSVTANLTLRISEAPVVLAEIPAELKECYHEQTLTATIAKDNVGIAGFEYVKAGSDVWTFVEASQTRASFAKGSSYAITLKDLELGTTYKYRAASGNQTEGITYRTEESTFTTGTLSQFPNASFEEWYTASDKALVPAVSGTETWDCGNHGSATMGVQLTQSNTDLLHSGKYGARLRSQFVGLGGSIGKFAAGNLFYGKYIKTDGTDGVIGFGRPMDFPSRELKPVAVKMWVKYETAAAIKSGAGDYLPQGSNDSGHIFIALFDAADNGDSDNANNGKYGFVVRTKKQARLFDKNASNVIAYGEQVYTENTPGDGLVELIIPFEYYSGKENVQPKLISIVCTASKYGDYFQGGEGSTMYVDDVEIVYGKK